MVKIILKSFCACTILYFLGCSNPFNDNNKNTIITADMYESDDTQSQAKQIYPDSTS